MGRLHTGEAWWWFHSPFQKSIAKVRSGRASHKRYGMCLHTLVLGPAMFGRRHRGLSLNDEKHRSGRKIAHERQRETALFQQLGDPIRLPTR
jgi:hypothetical protein